MQEIKESINQQAAMKGVYRIRKATLETEEQFALHDAIMAQRETIARISRQIEELSQKKFGFFYKRKIYRLQRFLEAQGTLFKYAVERLNSICRVETFYTANLLPTVGRAAVANHITSATPSPTALRANYVGLGTGTTAPSNSDTQLETETYRNTTASATNSSNIGYITGFFGLTETSGTFREVGLFMGATGTANSGTILSRSAINITKSTSNTLTIDWTLTIS